MGEADGYFTDCLNLDIYHKSKFTSWVVVEDTKLSEATKKDLSIKDYEIAKRLLPQLNEEQQKIISMYYNLDSENPDCSKTSDWNYEELHNL